MIYAPNALQLQHGSQTPMQIPSYTCGGPQVNLA